jgi:ferredoxin
MADQTPKPDELIESIERRPPATSWMDTPVNIRKGMYCYASNPKSVETLGFPNARQWNPLDDDWQLPENWQEILYEGFKERLEKFRSFKIFMDICVRCGACADKCHFLHRHRRPQEHAGAEGRAAAQRSTAAISPSWARSWADWPAPAP